MNINIARIILAIIAASGLNQMARAEPATLLAETPAPGPRLELSSAAFTPSYGHPLDAADSASWQGAGASASMRAAAAQNSGQAAYRAEQGASIPASRIGGIWLFLGSIWIIGTLVHHRQVIQKH